MRLSRRSLEVRPEPKPKPKRVRKLANDEEKITELRFRLSNISWFMLMLNEPIARTANAEDNVPGHFFGERFGSVRLENKEDPLLCRLYVDLNPVRAGLAKTPEDSKYTGACDRIEDRQEEEALQAAARECGAPEPLNLMKVLTRKHAGWMAPLWVDGDGYDDVAIGDTQRTSYTGGVYLFYGGASGVASGDTSTAAATVMGEATLDYFGSAVAGIGDINGDGRAELAVGAYNAGPSAGRAYLFYGAGGGISASVAADADATYTGGTTSALGKSVASAGDLNGDGYADLVIGAYPYQDVKGRVYLFLGGADGSMATDVSAADGLIDGEIEHGKLGRAVANAGDLDGDGRSDLVIGAPGDEYEDTTGYAYIFNGDAALGEHVASDADNTVVGASYLDEFGLAVSSGGDVNGDGYDEVLVAASSRDRSHGRVYLFQGSATGIYAIYATEAETTFTGDDVSDRFGISVASAGDVNGDGYADVIIGANGVSSGRGAAYVYLGGAAGLAAAPVVGISGPDVAGSFGYSVAGAGDLNGDGYCEVIVGAYQAARSAGRVMAAIVSPPRSARANEPLAGEGEVPVVAERRGGRERVAVRGRHLPRGLVEAHRAEAAAHDVLQRRHHVVAEARVVGGVEPLGDPREVRERAPVDARHDVDAGQHAVVVGGLVDAHPPVELLELHDNCDRSPSSRWK